MTTLKIKYPTLITSELNSHHKQYVELRKELVAEIDGYNNLPPTELLCIPYRGKSKSKVIKHINYDICNIGQIPSIIICVEEYKNGYDDLYLQKSTNSEVVINPEDKIGSVRNYALLYPVIEQHNNKWVNKWIVVIYDTPNKEDTDIINTIKYTVNKIFKYPFTYALPNDIAGTRVFPKIEVSFANIKNEDNEHIAVKEKIVSATVKTTHSIKYENVTCDEANEIIEDKGGVVKGIIRKVKVFMDPNNSSMTYTITQENDDGNFQSTLVAKYGYSQDVEIKDLPSINAINTMVRNFSDVITNYLKNGIRQ